MQFHFYRFSTIRVRHWKNVITGRKVAYYRPREGSKDKKEWLTFRPRIRLGMCILQYDSE
jgi:hypothetical protein